MEKSNAIEVRDLTLSRGCFGMAVPHLVVEEGTVVGLVGNNGAGKSTLLDTLAGFVPYQGTLRALGLDPYRDVVEFRQQMAWMTDEMALLPHLTVEKQARILEPFYPTWDRDYESELYQRFGVQRGKVIKDLSKGEGTRVRLVYSFAYRPRLVFLDEPTTGLDVPARHALMAEIMNLLRDGRRTAVISSHQVDDLSRIADRILLLENGRIVGDGTPESVSTPYDTLTEKMAAPAEAI